MPRKTKVVTTCLNGLSGRTVKDRLDSAMALLELACRLRPDVVCLPENFASAGIPLPPAERAEPVPGPTTDACATRARAHHTCVICPLLTAREGRVYNSAVVLDRAGGIVGVYDKVQPVTSRSDVTVMESGITPGAGAAVFDLDCGRIGIQICFDIQFPETWAELARQGAELVFWPSAYDGGLPLRLFAFLHGYYVVSSVRTSHARIINPLGEELDHTGPRQAVVGRTIDLDYIVCHYDFHHGIPDELIRTHGADLDLRMLHEEGRFLVESSREDLPLAEVINQFGLTPLADYIDAHRAAYPALRQGRTPTPQDLPFAGRQPYAPMTLEEWTRLRAARRQHD